MRRLPRTISATGMLTLKAAERYEEDLADADQNDHLSE
jgi:hypothetical protein